MKIKTYFKELNERDQIAVIMGIAVVILFLLYSLLISPLHTHVNKVKQELRYQTQLLQMMQHAKKQLKTKVNKQHLSETALLSTTVYSLKQNKLANFPHQLQQTANNQVQLTFKNVPFDHFLQWMSTYWQHYHLKLDTIKVDKTNTLGIVDTTLVFSIA